MSVISVVSRIPNVRINTGCANIQIEEAIKELRVSFPNEISEFLRLGGSIEYFGTEWTCLTITGERNMVTATLEEREKVPYLKDMVVLDRVNKIAFDCFGGIYSYEGDRPVKLSDSLEDYVTHHILKQQIK